MNQFVSKLIKSVLSSSPKSRKELLRITGLPERTLRYHLATLKEKGLVKENYNFSDLRKKNFYLVYE